MRLQFASGPILRANILVYLVVLVLYRPFLCTGWLLRMHCIPGLASCTSRGACTLCQIADLHAACSCHLVALVSHLLLFARVGCFGCAASPGSPAAYFAVIDPCHCSNMLPQSWQLSLIALISVAYPGRLNPGCHARCCDVAC